MRRRLSYLPDNRRAIAARRRPQRSQRVLGRVCGDDGHELPFVGDVQDVEAQELAGAAHRVAHGDTILEQDDAHVCVTGELVERGGHAASRRIAHPAHRRRRRVQQCGHQRGDRPRVRAQIGFEVDITAREKDGDAVIAYRAGEDNLIARLDQVARATHTIVGETDSRRGDVHAVGLAVFHNFRITAKNADAGAMRCLCHRPNLGFQDVARKAGFEDEGGHQRGGDRTSHDQVVHRAVDGEFPNRSSRKPQRPHDEGVGGQRNSRSIELQEGGVHQRSVSATQQ